MNCYHCAEEVAEPGAWQVLYDGKLRDVCCVGCRAVMQAIVDAGLGEYYRFRTEPAQFGVLPDNITEQLDQLLVFDEPEIAQRYLHDVDNGPAVTDRNLPDNSTAQGLLKEVNLSLEGLRCGACVWVLERTLRGSAGVQSAVVNFSSSRATVRFDSQQTRLSQLLKRIASVGYRATPFDVRERELTLKRESRVFLQRLFIAGIATMQVMMYALPVYVSDAGELDPAHEQLLRWASLALTTPVLLYSARPFLQGALRDLVSRRPGMDVPVSIGILAAFTASVWATVTATGDIYFDSVAMFVFLLLGARYLEWAARRRAMRVVDDISASAPETAQRVAGTRVETIPAVRLDVGDEILINEGDRIPVDAQIVRGSSAVDNSLVTGESSPVPVGPRDSVAGGALLAGAQVRARVLRRQSASTLSVIDRLIERGASEKPRTVQLADRIASLFVTCLLVFASLVFVVWMLVEPAMAAATAIAVLVVSCPCALSMATPAALAAATGDLLQQRLLITRGHVLDTLTKVTDVVFDKTGTLTEGRPRLVAFDVAPGLSKDTALEIAVALESGSSHPLAAALRNATGRQTLDCPTVESSASSLSDHGIQIRRVSFAAGHGVQADLDNGDQLRLGSRYWCRVGLVPTGKNSLPVQKPLLSDTSSTVYLSRLSGPAAESGQESHQSLRVLARFNFQDEIRLEVASIVSALQLQGKRVHLLSGDRSQVVEHVAGKLGIDQWRAHAVPEDKRDYVKDIQSDDGVVLMVGDGINDAPVLATADVSIAVGNATTLARNAADVISLQPGLEGLDALLKKSVQTASIVRQNLLWAATYNVTAIPMAALGWVPPWMAAIGMALSSLLVAANAQRLWKKNRPDNKRSNTALPLRLWNRFSC